MQAKASTTEQLVNAVQSPIPATQKTKAYLINRLNEGQTRRAEIEAIMLAFQSELDDQRRDIEALESALAVIDQKEHSQPKLEVVS